MSINTLVLQRKTGKQSNINNIKNVLKDLDCQLVLLDYWYEDVKENPLKELSLLAQEMGIYLAAGPFIENNGDHQYKTQFLLNTDGEVIIRQHQVFLTAIDLKNGYQQGDKLIIKETPLGRVALMSEEDCFHPEIGRFLALKGVDLVLATSQSGSNNYWKQLTGVWSQVQQNQFYALELARGGVPLLHAPCEITPYRTGILQPIDNELAVRNLTPDRYLITIDKKLEIIDSYKILSGSISLKELEKIKNEYPILNHLNPNLYIQSGIQVMI